MVKHKHEKDGYCKSRRGVQMTSNQELREALLVLVALLSVIAVKLVFGN